MTDTKFESPRLAIRIGIIGDWDLSGIDRKVIETQVSALLRMVSSTYFSLYRKYTNPLISGARNLSPFIESSLTKQSIVFRFH